ncbi:uncharacterized protein [Watersipora subatra]|uniref:uncharacterized protein n=1 Tax=Watersipora subatra TaxID=2589382 RepID=UPI00355C7360
MSGEAAEPVPETTTAKIGKDKADIMASYTVDCSGYVSSNERGKLIYAAAAANKQMVQRMCGKICLVIGEPAITCQVNEMIVKWQVSTPYRKVKSQVFKRRFESRTHCAKNWLLSITPDPNIPFAFPRE